jgi:uncharacterized protein YjbJ (UPF0337 family)
MQETPAMDKDRIIGSAKETKGAVKEAFGRATGDSKLRADGQAKKTEGAGQNAIGDVKYAVRDTLKE